MIWFFLGLFVGAQAGFFLAARFIVGTDPNE